MDYGLYLFLMIFMIFMICSGLLTGMLFLMTGDAVQGILSLACSTVLIFLCVYVWKRNPGER